MLEYSIEKGFCKKLYELNQVLKHLFSEFTIIKDGLCVDASPYKAVSINYVMCPGLFKEFNLDKFVLYTKNIYEVLKKGRQKVLYLRVTDDDEIQFIKDEDGEYTPYTIGKVIYELPNKDRISKLMECIRRLSIAGFKDVPEAHMKAMEKDKVAYLPCIQTEDSAVTIILARRLFDGYKCKQSMAYRSTDLIRLDDGSTVFDVEIQIDYGIIKAYYVFEASPF